MNILFAQNINSFAMTETPRRINWRYFSIAVAFTYSMALLAAVPLIRRDARPPLDAEWEVIKFETYRFYSDHGKMPTSTVYLPQAVRTLVG